jgi:hypothetical protein
MPALGEHTVTILTVPHTKSFQKQMSIIFLTFFSALIDTRGKIPPADRVNVKVFFPLDMAKKSTYSK